MDDADFEVLILGAGSGGYACALRAAQLGLRVALVEKDRLGGTCLHVGCIPTKALLHAAEVADATRDAARVGVRAAFEGVDLPALTAYQDAVVGRLHRGLTGLVAARGITVIQGEGRLTGPHQVTVHDTSGDTEPQAYTGRHLVLATGSHARTLPDLEIDGHRVLTSQEALRLQHLPASVLVIGGGVIGCEFASSWRSLGAEVTLLEALPRLVAGEDPASSAALERAFGRRGITVRTDTRFESLTHTATGVEVRVEGGEVLEAEVLLVAVGRAPTTEGLGYAEQGVAMQDNFVLTDQRCRTSAERVWAVGDIVPGPQLAHRGFAQGIFVAEEIAGLDPVAVEESAIPRVTYSSPEVASVGLHEPAAVAAYGAEAVSTVTYDLGGNGRSQILGTAGFVKLVRRVDGPVVGLHLVGDRVGELIGEAQLIYAWQAHPEDLAPLLHAHPTQNEALGEAHLALAGKALHAHS